jgi:2-oxoglutarate ferredoxin oxidoreductase subunit alpha
MMEPAELPAMRPLPEKRPDWATTGAIGRPRNIITSLHLDTAGLERLNQRVQQKLSLIQQNHEVRYEEQHLDDAELAIVAFGTAARVAQTAVKRLRANGVRAGLFRPITLWPFPEPALAALAQQVERFLVVEMNAGQMLHDVREAVGTAAPVHFLGRVGGRIPLPEEIEEAVVEINNERMRQ